MKRLNQLFSAESKAEFTNNSLNSQKTGKMFLGWNQGPGPKLQTKKSHATVSLSQNFVLTPGTVLERIVVHRYCNLNG